MVRAFALLVCEGSLGLGSLSSLGLTIGSSFDRFVLNGGGGVKDCSTAISGRSVITCLQR